ncbi:MAG: acetyltransferase [Bacteroidales bacterium]|nr:acetyltransferase [Bacteroidales bacterium]
MKHLLIIGARGWGREVYDIAVACMSAGADFDVKGFLDDKSEALDGLDNYPPIISSVEDYNIQKDDVFICALGGVNYKKHYAQIILDKGGEFISLIHPTAVIGTNAKIGKGCVVGAFANLSNDTQIGNFVTISLRSGMGHDTTIDDYCHIGGHCSISGFVTIGKSVVIHPGAVIVSHRKIGDNAVIGIGSVVLGNIKEGTTVFGNPAKKIDF